MSLRYVILTSLLCAALAVAFSSGASSANRSGHTVENVTHGTVWNDANRNGIQDSGEQGVDGVTVRLLNSENEQVDTTTTSAGGLYHFSNLSDGDYAIQFVKPAGYLLTSKDQGEDDNVDSDADPSTGRTDQIHLQDNSTDVTLDAGLMGTSVGGRAFGDTNGNGLQDADEGGISGLTVRLLDGGNPIATTVTASDGSYQFPVNGSGPYSIELVAPRRYQISPQNQGSDDTLDSDAGEVPASLLPQNWTRERSQVNPVVPLGSGDVNTIDEQYQPAVIRVANGDVWIYVKGTRKIYAFKSTDNGETFAIQNGGAPVLEGGAPGSWDDGYVVDPCVVYEPATDTIHLYYKGGHYDTNDLEALYRSTGWGHATASGSSPMVFHKDGAPILTTSAALAALGTSNIVDLRLHSVLKIGGTFYFYGQIVTGTSYINGSDYLGRIFYATGNSWTTPIVRDYAFPNHSDDMVANGWVDVEPMVFKQPGSPVYTMIFAQGGFFQGEGYTRNLMVATSRDGRVWKQTAGAFLSPGNDAWEAKMVYGASILRATTGDYSAPESVNGKYLVYYSGLNMANQACSGLVRVVPEEIPDQLVATIPPFNVVVGQTDDTQDVGVYASDGGSFSFGSSSGFTRGGTVTATPYPSNISVAGLSGVTSKVTVTIKGFKEPVPDDIDMLLVGPLGQTFLFWSGAGSTSLAESVDITLDDDASSQLPLDSSPSSGSFKPTNGREVEEFFPPPAPAEAYGNPGPGGGGSATFGSVFNGTSPNGTWSLYVRDHATGFTLPGSIDSWSLNVSVAIPVDAVNDDLGTDEGAAFSGNILDNDLGSPAPIVKEISGCSDQATPFECITAAGATLTVNEDGRFVYRPPANFNGSDGFTYKAGNSNGDDTATVNITIKPVVGVPMVTAASTSEDTQTESGLVITPNVTDGADVNYFKITRITNGILFKHDGVSQISEGQFITVAEGSAGLKFTPAGDLFSPSSLFSFAVQASLNESDTGLGRGESIANITVDPVGEQPSVTDATTLEDTQTATGLVITRNAIDGDEITHFKITNIYNGTLFRQDGFTRINEGDSITVAEGAAGLKFTPVPNSFSSPGSFFGFYVAEETNAAGAGLGPIATGNVTVNRVADKPVVTNAVTNEDTQTDSMYIGRNGGDGAEVTHFRITQITNGRLFKYDGTTQINNGDFISVGEAGLGVKFIPNSNLFSPFSSFSFSAQSSLSDSESGLSGEPATAVITVVPFAEIPAFTNANTSEDVQTNSGLVITRSPLDGNEVTHFKITAISNGRLFKNDGITQINNGDLIGVAEGGAGLKFTPSANLFGGPETFGFNVAGATSSAGAGLGPAARVGITVNAVADTPAVTNATTTEGTQTTSGLVITRNSADGSEVTNFKITGISNGALFKHDGTTAIANGSFITSVEGAAGLRFTPADHLNSPASTFQFTVQAALSGDDGGVGGNAATATITVGIVLETPSVTTATTNEDTTTETGLIVTRNVNDGAEVKYFQISGISNGTLFKHDGLSQLSNGDYVTAAEGGAGLKFTPAANLFSPATSFSFQVKAAGDTSGTALSENFATATLTVNAVADTPAVTNATTTAGAQTTSGLVITRNSADGSEVSHFRITNIQNGKLFRSDGASQINNGDFITAAEGGAGLKFTPTNGFFGTGAFDVQASTGNNVSGLGGSVVAANIRVDTGTIYVDDDFAGRQPSADPDGSGPATDLGVDAFARIKDGLAAAGAGTVVRVAAGTYNESVDLNQTTIVNIDGPVTLAGNMTVTKGTLALNSVLSVTNGIVSVGAEGSITRTTGYIIGAEKRACSGPGKLTFVVGTSNGYSPVEASVTSGAGELTVVAVQGPLAAVNAARSLQRFWLLTGSGVTSNLTFHYPATDVSGSESNYKILRIEDASFNSYAETVIDSSNPNDHTATVNGINSFSIWTLAEPGAQSSDVSGRIVDSQGNPLEGAAILLSGPQSRLTITDAQGNYRFANVNLDGVYTVTPARANFIINPGQRSFTQFGLHTDASFVAAAVSNGLNPLDTTEYFVRQQYLDLLHREPDESGFNFWVRNIDNCGADQACRQVQRINTSAAFFLSIEFQQTGFFVYRTYQAAYGDMPGAPVPISLNEFTPDTGEIGNGVVVNQSGWETTLENNKQAYLTKFVQRTRFTAAYPATMSPSDFVDRLYSNAGFTPSPGERAAAVGEFGAANTTADITARVRALRRVVDSPTMIQQQFNQAFVLMQYFGYLRRNPNAAPDNNFSGFDFWLTKLNQFNGSYQDAEMVRAFLESIEYRSRFPR